VFIHIYKNGGSSIRRALAPYSDERKSDYALDKLHTLLRRTIGWDLKYLKDMQKYPNHFSAHDLPEIIADHKSYFKFAIVRNPWDAQVSHYHYGKRNIWLAEHKIYRKFQSFEQYIEWRQHVGQRSQKSFIYSADKSLVDFIGRYENLDEDFQSICKRIKVQASLPAINVSKRDHYHSYYNDKTRKIVEQMFQEDIDTFGYTF